MKRNVSLAIGALIFIFAIFFGMFIFGDSDTLNPSSDSDDNLDISNADSNDNKNQAISPSVKIESITATLKEKMVYDKGSGKLCTVTISGTVTGPEGSFFLIKDGEMPDGSPGGLLEGDYKCPDWNYIWTSGVCTRYVDNSKATTQWSIIVDEVYFSGFSSEEYMYPDYPAFTERFTAILRIPTEESEEEIMDSIYLTC